MEALALSNKRGVEGRREREKILPKKKKGSKFLCTRRKLGVRQTTVWTFQGGDTRSLAAAV